MALWGQQPATTTLSPSLCTREPHHRVGKASSGAQLGFQCPIPEGNVFLEQKEVGQDTLCLVRRLPRLGGDCFRVFPSFFKKPQARVSRTHTYPSPTVRPLLGHVKSAGVSASSP